MIFRTFFLLFTASVRSRPPGPPAVPGVFCKIIIVMSRDSDVCYHWNRPDQADMRCGCPTIGPVKYDPNDETGAGFYCAGREASYFQNPAGFTLNSSDVCELYCFKGD